jgi:transcriptional regulator with XRE-family HTH domain
VDTSFLSGIERRNRNPSWEKIRLIAKVLELDASELIRRAEEIADRELEAGERRAQDSPGPPAI